MNDKNFIEELRQKREEYGVTQTRLAVACGISREYYNRIEKGKQPLNDELREIIEKQIERFNPQEPLFLLIDYFRVRFPTTDALAIIRDVLQLKADYMLYEDYGKYGYESKYVLGDINIMCSMQEHLGVLLELKGKGCRQMECYLLAQERSWYDFMLDCMTAGGVMKRLDLAINDRAGILDIPKLKEKYKAGECVSYFRMQKDYSGTEKCGSDLPKNTGETLYLGSTSSELYMCAYQKNYEQYVKNGTEIEDTEIKNRFEIRMKNERAYYAVVDLLTYRDAERTAVRVIWVLFSCCFFMLSCTDIFPAAGLFSVSDIIFSVSCKVSFACISSFVYTSSSTGGSSGWLSLHSPKCSISTVSGSPSVQRLMKIRPSSLHKKIPSISKKLSDDVGICIVFIAVAKSPAPLRTSISPIRLPSI